MFHRHLGDCQDPIYDIVIKWKDQLLTLRSDICGHNVTTLSLGDYIRHKQLNLREHHLVQNRHELTPILLSGKC